MAKSDQHIRVENGTQCSDGVVRYRINVKNKRIVVRRFNDFKDFDAMLANVYQKPTLPSAGYDVFKFNEPRREGLESYLNQLCAGDARQTVLNTFLRDTPGKLFCKSAAAIEPYSTPELKALGFNAFQLSSKGRTAELEEERCKDRTLNHHDYSSNVLVVLSKELPVKKAVQVFGKDRVLQSHLFSTYDLKQCGFTVQELKDHKYNSIDICEAGFSMNELMEVGLSINQAFEDVPPMSSKPQSMHPVEPKRASCFQFLRCGCLPYCGLTV